MVTFWERIRLLVDENLWGIIMGAAGAALFVIRKVLLMDARLKSLEDRAEGEERQHAKEQSGLQDQLREIKDMQKTILSHLLAGKER